MSPQRRAIPAAAFSLHATGCKSKSGQTSRYTDWSVYLQPERQMRYSGLARRRILNLYKVAFQCCFGPPMETFAGSQVRLPLLLSLTPLTVLGATLPKAYPFPSSQNCVSDVCRGGTTHFLNKVRPILPSTDHRFWVICILGAMAFQNWLQHLSMLAHRTLGRWKSIWRCGIQSLSAS